MWRSGKKTKSLSLMSVLLKHDRILRSINLREVEKMKIGLSIYFGFFSSSLQSLHWLSHLCVP